MVRMLLLLIMVLPVVSWAEEPRCPKGRAPASEWVRDQVGRATYVFYGTVTFVEPPPIDSGEHMDIPTVTVLENYKGNFKGGVLKPSYTGWGVLPGESAVFFVDSSGRLLRCSSYRNYLSDFGAISEIRRVLAGGT